MALLAQERVRRFDGECEEHRYDYLVGRAIVSSDRFVKRFCIAVSYYSIWPASMLTNKSRNQSRASTKKQLGIIKMLT